jgi:DNA adenine methylase
VLFRVVQLSFLNRTNRSGVIGGGVIGGNKQKGNYKMTCRFNKRDLIERIKLIKKFRKYIHLENLDALDLIKKIQLQQNKNNVIFYFDPPYFLKGSSLYTNYYVSNDHQKVSSEIRKIKNAKWVVSYDNVPEIQSLYKGFKKINYSFTHIAYIPREGRESLFFSDNLFVPQIKNPIKI